MALGSAPFLAPLFLSLAGSGDLSDELAAVRDDALRLRGDVGALRRAVGAVRLRVNGELVPPDALERAAAYIFGRGFLDRQERLLLAEAELEAQAREKGQPIEVKILREEVEREAEQMRQEIEGRAQGVSVDAVLRAYGLGGQGFHDEMAAWAFFDRVFIPDDPDAWPETSKQALAASGGGQQFVDQMLDSLRQGKAQAEEKGQPFTMPPFYKQLFRQWISKEVRKVADVRTASDGLPPDLVLMVSGRPLPTSVAYAAVAPQVTVVEREKLLRWVAVTTALRQELRKAGTWLDDEGFRKAYEEYAAPYKDSPFSVEIVAINFKHFPSIETWREFFRMRESYRGLVGKEMTDEALRKHAERARDFLGEGKVDVQVILCSAYDFQGFEWKGPDAFDDARMRAEEVMAALEKGENFDVLLDRHSQFYEPPANPQQPGQPRPNRGRFGPQGKNPLRNLLGESEYDEFLRGFSLADFLFHEVAVGETVGPLRGPYGYYVARVVARTPGYKEFDLSSEQSRKLIEEDFLSYRFFHWANEVLSRAKVEIL